MATDAGDLVSAPGLFKLSFENGAGQVVETALRIVGEAVIVEMFPTVAE